MHHVVLVLAFLSCASRGRRVQISTKPLQGRFCTDLVQSSRRCVNVNACIHPVIEGKVTETRVRSKGTFNVLKVLSTFLLAFAVDAAFAPCGSQGLRQACAASSPVVFRRQKPLGTRAPVPGEWQFAILHGCGRARIVAKADNPNQATDDFVDTIASNCSVRQDLPNGRLQEKWDQYLPSRRTVLAAVVASVIAPNVFRPQDSSPTAAVATPGFFPLEQVDIGRSAFNAVEAELSPDFTALLARFLINNEEVTYRWWEQKQREARALEPADSTLANPLFPFLGRRENELQKTYLLTTFSELVTSVEVGLQKVKDAGDVRKFASLLRRRYKSRAQKRQLAQLFSLIDKPDLQPASMIQELLAEADNAYVDSLALVGIGERPEYIFQTADPEVIISPPPTAKGRTAKAKPVLRATGRFRAVQLLDGGFGYADGEQPKVTITLPSPKESPKCERLALVSATTKNGMVDALVLEDAGSGYVNLENIQCQIDPPINRQNDARAARAMMFPEYKLIGLEVVDGGSGYNVDEPPMVMVRERFKKTNSQNQTENMYPATAVMNSATARGGDDAVLSPSDLQVLETELKSASLDNGLKLPLEVQRSSGKNGTKPTVQTLPSLLVPRRNKITGMYRLPLSIPLGAFGKRADVPVESQQPLSLSDALKIFLSGGLCSSTAHSLLVPIDVVKTALQQDTGRYEGPIDCARDLVAKDGPGGLLRGAGSTFAGYAVAGAMSFGFVEVLGRALRESTGPGIALLFSSPLLVTASIGATAICAVAVCPFEAVRVQSVKTGESGLQVLQEILSSEGFGALYRGFPPILFKEIPFVVTKFAVFEFAIQTLRAYVENVGMISTPVLATELTVLAGAIAGVASILASQPADAAFTLANDGPGATLTAALGQLKEKPALIANGLGPRLLFGVLLVTLQFFFYTLLRESLGVSKSHFTLVWDALAPLRG